MHSFHQSRSQQPGTVALVGAGPGDPDLLTQRAVRRLADADVVFHDHLVDPRILALATRAERVYVGKIGGGRATAQRAIHELLLAAALDGQRVVRLKGGDPFVFGRGGEEALFLQQHGVPVEHVPGISSALAAPAAAGVPVTHRGVAAHVSIVTAVGDPSRGDGLEPTWVALARTGGTVVFLMGLARLERIVSALLEGGIPASRPAAVVSAAHTPQQRVVRAALGQLAAATRDAGLRAPATVVVGDVAALGIDLHVPSPAPAPEEAHVPV